MIEIQRVTTDAEWEHPYYHGTIAIYGSSGRMGSFHKKRLYEEHPYLNIVCFDPAGDTEDDLTQADAVIIATPSETHFEIAKNAILSGKHVLCEKPIAFDYREAVTLYRLAQDMDVVFMAGHTERFNPIFRANLSELLMDRGSRWFSYIRLSDRECDVNGIVFDSMIHDLEIACYLNNDTEIDRDIELIDPSEGNICVSINGLGYFEVGCGDYEKTREIRIGNHGKLDFLGELADKPDALKAEHDYFLKLCAHNISTGHARYAVAAVGLAQQIVELLDG